MLVHVDTSPHDYACPLQASVLSGARTHREVQTDVAQLLRNLPVPRGRMEPTQPLEPLMIY